MKFSAILTIGSEIVEGIICDENSRWLSKELLKLGWKVRKIVSVSDEMKEIIRSVINLMNENDLLVITGGLGPTKDDITREAVSKALNLPLYFDEELYKKIREKVKNFAGEVVESIKNEAMVLEGAKVIENDIGSAPGQFIQKDGKKVLILPGPPPEMKNIFEKAKIHIDTPERLHMKILKFYGVRESILEDKLKDLIYGHEGLEVAFQASYTEGVFIRFVYQANKQNAVNEIVKRIKSGKFGIHIYAEDDITMEETVVGMLIKQGKTLSVAESCTGGMLSSSIVNVAGASKIFKGGIIAYSNKIKQKILGVSGKILKDYGAVSKECVMEMLKGLKKSFETDFGIAISGIAGPTGGSKEKPVGTVYIGIYNGDSFNVLNYNFKGGRNIIRRKTVMTALDILRRKLLGGIAYDER